MNDLTSILDESSSLAVVVGGFQFTEGPVWNPHSHDLLFSDIPASRTFCLNAGVLSVAREDSNKANGNTFDLEGRLISCEHLTSSVVRLEHDGSRTILASHFEGRELNSPNDVIVDSRGDIYFTDPVFGRTEEAMGRTRDIVQSVRGVYRVTSDASAPELIIASRDAPNGLCLSVDERFLFVNDTTTDEIWRFEMADELPLVGQLWAHPVGEAPGSVDGMKFDAAGNLYCTGPGGVFVYSPDAELLGVIAVPEPVGNFTWGDPDLLTLYLCASTTLYSVRVTVPGIPLF
jgi:gluconolactonase